MTAATHVALIRGINVGGNNPVPMGRLAESLTAAGFESVRTYIQSGNVVLRAPGLKEKAVAAKVQSVLAAEFDVSTPVVAVTAKRLRAAVAKAPRGFGSEPDTYHYDVCFLDPSVPVDEAVAAFKLREGVDALWPGEGAIYFRRLSAQRTKSRMNSVMQTPVYKLMTIRNWRTTTKLVEMLDG